MSCFKSTCQALKKIGIPCDVVDINGLLDSSLSCAENVKNVLSEVGGKPKRDFDYYAEKYAGFYKKKMCKNPVKVKSHCRQSCKVKVKAHKRKCPGRY